MTAEKIAELKRLLLTRRCVIRLVFGIGLIFDRIHSDLIIVLHHAPPFSRNSAASSSIPSLDRS